MSTPSLGLLAGVADGTLEARIARPPYDALWRRLVSRTRELLDRANAAPGGVITYGSLGCWSASGGVIDAALVWRLSGDARALAYVERCIDALALLFNLPSDVDPALRKIVSGGLPFHSHAEVPLAADLCRDGLSPRAIELLRRTLMAGVLDAHDDGRSLRMYSAGANIPVARNLGAAVAALVWGQDVGHSRWQRIVEIGRDNVIGYLRRGLDPQGFPFEGPGYAGDTSHHLYLYAQLLRQRGFDDLFASEPALERFADALIAVLFPNRACFGNINDLGFFVPWSLPYLPLTAKAYGRPDHMGLWQEFQGPDNPLRPYGDFQPHYERTTGVGWTQGCHVPSLPLTLLWWDADAPVAPLASTPVPLALHSRGTEYCTFRTSWSSDAVFANFLGGGRGHVAPGHVHSDSGHFAIVAHGDYLAMDTGRYNTDEDQHNVVLVDGKCHMPIGDRWGSALRSGRILEFRRHRLLDYALADMAHTKNCIWADRHFLFVRTPTAADPDAAYVVILDNFNVQSDYRSYWWQLHTPPENVAEILGPARATIRGPHARLDIDFALPSPEDFPQRPHTLALRVEEAWWYTGKASESEGNLKLGLYNTSVRRTRLVAEFAGLNGLMLTVISPRRRDQPPRVVRNQTGSRVLRFEIEHEAGVDMILAAPDNGFIQQPDVEGFTELALLRRDRDGRLLDHWASEALPLRRIEPQWPKR